MTREEHDGRRAETDERLLELLLRSIEDAQPLTSEEARELADLRDDPEHAHLVDDLAPLARRVRATRGTSRDRRAPRGMGGRILARSTREDLSWRGELRLVGGFLRERLVQSPALRWVAASLLLHMVAWPFVATEGGRRRAVRIFGPPMEAPSEVGVAGDVPVASPDDDGDGLDPGLPQWPDGEGGELGGPPPGRIDNALRRARFVLTTARQEPGVLPADERTSAELGHLALEIQLLSARSRYLHGGDFEAWLEEKERFDAADGLQRALWVQLLLDRLCLEGVRGELLAPGLNRIALVERAGSVSRLEALVLARARAYGVWEAPADFVPESVPMPLTPPWRAALAADIRPRSSAADPFVQAWIR